MRIIAEHLSYTYNERSPFETAALHDVTLTIEEGSSSASSGIRAAAIVRLSSTLTGSSACRPR